MSEASAPQPITSWSVVDDVVQVSVDTCNGDSAADVVETSDSVTITVTSTQRENSGDCLDGVEVALDAPLDDRVVVDGATGRELEPMNG